MLLIGHSFIPSQKFYHIVNMEQAQHTPPSSTLWLPYSQNNLEIIEHLQNNQIDFALDIKDITELIYASTLGAKFVTCSEMLAKTAQKIAENYLFDTKILVHIDDDRMIEEIALLGIDGVIFPAGIVKAN
ncbi:MAG: hypothetical protein FAF05_05760 [Epsilonproteobacteria bacterium]|nr:hypothetical protein [Campylobacterota bacterium]